MLRIFRYLENLDCFTIDPEYKIIADKLGLTEWNEVAWIGRYFALDNDYGEHWFDNWELREKIEDETKKLGFDSAQIFVIDPERFKNAIDGPCHTNEERKLFWTDVLKTFQLSYDTIFAEANHLNEGRRKANDVDYIQNLEERIEKIKMKINREY